MAPIRALAHHLAVLVLVGQPAARIAAAQADSMGPAGDSAARDTFVVPPSRGFVNDFADVLTAAEETRIRVLAAEVRAKSPGEIVVVILPGLHGLTAAEAARRIGNSWGVGRAGGPEDPAAQVGAVLLIAPREREYRLELAVGAARLISDSAAAELLKVNLAPALRRSAYGEGIYAAVRAVAQRFATRFGFTLEE